MKPPIEYEAASAEVRLVYDDILATRRTGWINNFWKIIASHPPTLRRIWAAVKEVMVTPSAIDPLSKEFIYIAVSITNNCRYCLASHTAAAREKGATEEQISELIAIVALANETNRLAIGFDVEIDKAFTAESGTGDLGLSRPR